jgi:hypothetical protein
MANNQTITTVLKIIAQAYPQRFELDADTVRVWASFVADIPDELLSAAVARFISSSVHAFPPTIPEIRQQATELKREIIGIPSAYEAWDELIKAPLPRPVGSVYRLFRDGKPVDDDEYIWPHEIVGIVARRLGWPDRFPGTETEMADRSHFVKAYDAEVRKMMQAETQIPQVTKYIEQEKSKALIDVSGDLKQLSASMGMRRKS